MKRRLGHESLWHDALTDSWQQIPTALTWFASMKQLTRRSRNQCAISRWKRRRSSHFGSLREFTAQRPDPSDYCLRFSPAAPLGVVIFGGLRGPDAVKSLVPCTALETASAPGWRMLPPRSRSASATATPSPCCDRSRPLQADQRHQRPRRRRPRAVLCRRGTSGRRSLATWSAGMAARSSARS